MSSTHRLLTEGPSESTSSWKRGVRVLGVAESFEKDQSYSVLAGVVMRGDLRIDGFSVCTPAIGGHDSTDELVSMFIHLNRKDIRAWMLGGSVISWFNIVDIISLYERTETPVICISYHPSEGIEKYLKEYFPEDWKLRQDVLERTGVRTSIQLKTGHTLYLSVAGVSVPNARNLLNSMTLDGRIPEPVRVARTISAGLHRDFLRKVKSSTESIS
jgi:endonuclease V-like protein UPF0215 family